MKIRLLLFFISFFFLFFITSISINAQQLYRIMDIRISGNITISENEIKNYLSIYINCILQSEKLINIEQKLLNWGYFESVIIEITNFDDQNKSENIDENEIRIIIEIKVEENLPIKKLDFQNLNIYVARYKEKMLLKENKAFNSRFLEKDLSNIANLPFVSRVSSKIVEEEGYLIIEIMLKYKNEFSANLKLSDFVSVDFNLYEGKFFFPFYLSSIIFYPFQNKVFYPIVGFSSGISFFKGFYLNFNYYSLFSIFKSKFDYNFVTAGFIYKGFLIQNKNLTYLLNPIEFNISYSIDETKFNNLFLLNEFYIKYKNIFNIYNKSSFTYNFSTNNNIEQVSYYGNTPLNGNESNIFLNKSFNIFFYNFIFNLYPVRGFSEYYLIKSQFIFFNTLDLIIKLFSTQILYFGFVISSDYIAYKEIKFTNKITFGIGLVFSISIKNIIELPLSLQYFWINDFNDGVFYFSFLSKRFF